MTRLNRRQAPTTTGSRDPARRAAHRPVREARARRTFDGVVASYIRSLQR
jgi:hypothetical protein